MNIDLGIRFLNPPDGRDEFNERAVKIGYGKRRVDYDEVLCFRHAALAAIIEGRDIKIEIDEFGSEYDGRRTVCERCDDDD